MISQAQTSEKSDVKVILKSGTVLVGELISYDPAGDLVFDLKGNLFTIPSSAVKKIVMKTSSIKQNLNRLATKKVYHRTNVGTLSNVNGSGISLNYSALYLHEYWLGIGVGTGIDNYYFSEGRNVYPLFVELKSFLVDKNASPFVSLKTGYGFIVPDKDIGQTNTKGGMIINPTFGYRFGTGGVIFDSYIGFRFQKAEYDTFTGWETSHQNIQWNRVELGFAFSF